MGLQIIEKTTLGSQPVRGCAVSIISCSKKLTFDLRLGVDVMERLGASRGDRLVVERGEGKHANQLRLKMGIMSGFRISISGKGSRAGHIRLSSLAGKQKHGITPAPYKFSSGYLYVELPDWACVKPAAK